MRARLVLAERDTKKEIDKSAVSRLIRIATQHESAANRLRAVWCLHAIGHFSEHADTFLTDANEFVRAWTIQLLAEQPSLANESLILSILEREQSPLVRLYLASAAQRLSTSTAWRILETLSLQEENVAERNLPLLIWHSLAPLIASDLTRADRLIDRTVVPVVRHSLSWYLPQLSDEGRQLMTKRLANATGRERARLLELFAGGLAGSRNLSKPSSWDTVAKTLYVDPTTSSVSMRLGAIFGDTSLYTEQREILRSEESSLEARKQAVALLELSSDPLNLPVLLKCIDIPELRSSVLRQLGRYDDPRVASELIHRLPKLEDGEKEAALNGLCSRATSANLLIQAMEDGAVEKEELTGFFARQIANLGEQQLIDRLESHWGKLTKSSAEKKDAVNKLVAAYKKAPLWAYDRNNGAKHFQKLCANCHVDSKTAARIGPKLDETGAKGIEYIVENVVDPNAVIGKDFLARNVLTSNGLTVTGVVTDESDTAITVRTATGKEVIARNDIEDINVSTSSFMPEGLLSQLNDREQVELLLYLMSLK